MLSPQDLNRADLRSVLRDASRKQGFVTPMFEHIAPRYDAFTRLFSFGMDAAWKRTLLDWLVEQSPAPRTIVDLACGTGDLAFGAAQRIPGARIVGLDAAERMVALANERLQRIPSMVDAHFDVADLIDTRLPDASVDAVLAGYAFRNIPTLAEGLAEVARILRPGGRAYVLDFYLPASPWWRRLFLAYLRAAGSAVGWWWHRAPVMYAYIADSIDAYVSITSFETELSRHGLVVDRRRSMLGGGVALHAATRR